MKKIIVLLLISVLTITPVLAKGSRIKQQQSMVKNEYSSYGANKDVVTADNKRVRNKKNKGIQNSDSNTQNARKNKGTGNLHHHKHLQNEGPENPQDIVKNGQSSDSNTQNARKNKGTGNPHHHKHLQNKGTGNPHHIYRGKQKSN